MSETQSGEAKRRTSKLAVWSLVLGILSIFPLGLLSAIPAVICGHIGLFKIKQSSGGLSGRGLAIAGLVIGYLGITLVPVKFVALTHAREKAREVICLTNLQQIYIQCEMWANDNEDKLPENTEQLRAYASTLSEPNPKFFVCPAAADKSKSSYEIVARGNLSELPKDAIIIREIERNHKGKRGVVYAGGKAEMVSQ